MFIENLLKIGLSEKEAKMYLMLLRIGPAPASSIARRVGMKRVTAYSVLDSLRTQGLVAFENSGNTRTYIPLDPEMLLYKLEQKNAELRVQIALAKECIDELHRNATIFGCDKNNMDCCPNCKRSLTSFA